MAASTFSYAQAAKGLSTPVASSKPASESGAPVQEINASIRSVQSWADDAETEMNGHTAAAHGAQTQNSKPAQSAQPIETSIISSPDLGASSSSTVTKDDDVSSLPNASSESTWDNKSQASTSVDKSVEPVEKTSEKAKKGKSAPAKPLQEAPLPAVNIWKKRAEELKSKVPKPEPTQNNAAQTQNKRSESDLKGRAAAKGQDEDRHAHGRKDTRAEGEARSKGRFSDKDAKVATNNLPAPPSRDQESWPTPDTAVDEDRKKAQDKGGDKERKEATTTASHGKQEWVKVPYTPSVVFNTPLPNAAGSRRGGRPGGRGGAQPGGRAAAFASNGTGAPEKDAPAGNTATGEQAKRDRTENGAARDTSPRAKRTGGASSPTHNGAPAEKTSQVPDSTGAETSVKTSNGTEQAQPSNQGGAYTRSYPNRSNKPRRGDFGNAGERRRDGETSPAKDNTFDDRRANTDPSGEGDRRHSSYHDGPNGHHKQGRFGSYSGGRERARGGNRGGRGYTNGHQYSNGHVQPIQTSTSFPMGPRSPTTFNPENPSFFSAPQGKYGRSGNRSQSVTTDAYRFAPYQNGAQVPAVQGYGMYDYNMMPQPPMSAMPYGPYVDHFALFAMITTQVEYYFSVENLIKDMYLRKQMDSQGFVYLETIANFHRIKQLSTDIELIKLVCQQSAVVEYRTGEDGQDRLRRREKWDQWVLSMADRDAKAQNEGPKELRMPHVNGFDQANGAQWAMPAYAADGSYPPQMNGYPHAVGQDSTYPTDAMTNGTDPEKAQENALPNGHSAEAATNA